MRLNYLVSYWRPGYVLSQQFLQSIQLFALTLLLAFSYTTANAQVVISEVFANGTFELRNDGNSPVNVSAYWICDFPDYRRLDQLEVECGSLNLMAGAEVVLTAPGLHETDDSELGLYTRNAFGDASALISYLEWGSGNHQRSGLAVGNGIWNGNAAAAFNNNQSLERTDDGFDAADWTVNSSPMACATSGDEEPTCNVDGGTITTNDRLSICVDGIADPINVTPAGGVGPNRGWVITDDQRNILALPAAPPFDLDGAGVGTCFIYYIRYVDGLEGLAAGQNLNNLQGCWDLSNRLEVVRQVPDGGRVTTQGGMTEFTATAGNVMVPVTRTTEATALSYWYIITDDNDNILDFLNPGDASPTDNATLDLSAAPVGVCRIWGWSYRGEGDPIRGDNISTLTDGVCETISDNFIMVNRLADTGGNDCNVDGGTISTNDRTSICVDGITDPINVTVSGATGEANRGWVITDDQRNILALPAAPPFDLDGAGVGICFIYYIRYEDDLEGLAAGQNLNNLQGCWDLSNRIEVIRQTPDGGRVTLQNGGTEYTGTAGNIMVPVTRTTTASALSYWYIITDDNDNILAFHNPGDVSPTDDATLDLSAAPAGVCRIWGWSYRGEGDPIPGDNISTLTDGACETISDNFVTVNRLASADDCNVDGGTISTNDRTSICVDGIADPIDVTVSGATGGANRGWVITDDQRNILALPAAPPFDLDGAGVGTCFIYYIRYEDGLQGLATGQNLNNLQGCWDLSNRIEVIRQTPDGGQVTLQNGGTEYTATAGNVMVPVTRTTAATALSYWYIITDDNDNILDFLNPGDASPTDNATLDLSAAPPGVCRIWGWSYRGEGDPIRGDNISTLTDGACEAISTNFVRVIRQEAVAPATPIRYTANLTGSQEVCPKISTGYGSVEAILTGNTLKVSGSFANMIGKFDANVAGGAHIHFAPAGRNGGVELLLTTRPTGDLKGGTFRASDNTFTLTDGQVSYLQSRELYINIHTTVFASGELRGQLLPAADAYYQANLLGINEVPTNNSSATGNVLLELRGNQLVATGAFEGFSSEVATDLAGGGHIHRGFAGRNGDIELIFDITLDEDQRGGRLEAVKNTFTLTPGQLTYLKQQELYINFHSQVNRPGEVRGQIAPLGATYFVGNLEGEQEVPAINVPSNGRVHITYDGQNAIYVSGAFNDLQGDLNTDLAGGGHIHLAPRGANGPVIFPLDIQLAADKRNAVFLPQNNKFVLNSEELEALFTEGLYVNIHSRVNVPGEIRGQIVGQTIEACGNPDLAINLCPTPTNLTATSLDARRTRLDWDRVFGAAKYQVEIRFAGKTRIIARARIRNNRVFVFAPSGRDYEVRIKTICQDGGESDYTPWLAYSTPSSLTAGAQSRSNTQIEEDADIINIAAAPITYVSVYPNPVSDVLTVAYQTVSNTGVLTVYHVSGKQVLVNRLGRDEGFHQVNLGDLPDGAYILTIQEAGKLPHTERIIKGTR